MLYYKMKKTNFYRSRKLCFLEEKELTISLISVFKLAFDVSFPEPDFLKKRFRSKKNNKYKKCWLTFLASCIRQIFNPASKNHLDCTWSTRGVQLMEIIVLCR